MVDQLGITALTICLSGLAFLLDVVGIAIPYWLNYGGSSVLGSFHMGLWKVCITDIGQLPQCSSIKDLGLSSSHNACIYTTIAMVIISIVLLCIAMVCHFLRVFIKSHRRMLTKVAGITGIVGGIFGIAGCGVFAGRFNGYRGPGVGGVKIRLHAGYALVMIASIKGIISGALTVAFLNRDH